MLTAADIKKLVTEFKKIFATKDDLKAFATRQNIKNLEDKMDEIALNIVEEIGELMKEVKDIKYEIRGQRITLGDHEDRLQSIEKKYLA